MAQIPASLPWLQEAFYRQARAQYAKIGPFSSTLNPGDWPRLLGLNRSGPDPFRSSDKMQLVKATKAKLPRG
jgi:hypothetical protein